MPQEINHFLCTFHFVFLINIHNNIIKYYLLSPINLNTFTIWLTINLRLFSIRRRYNNMYCYKICKLYNYIAQYACSMRNSERLRNENKYNHSTNVYVPVLVACARTSIVMQQSARHKEQLTSEERSSRVTHCCLFLGK